MFTLYMHSSLTKLVDTITLPEEHDAHPVLLGIVIIDKLLKLNVNIAGPMSDVYSMLLLQLSVLLNEFFYLLYDGVPADLLAWREDPILGH